LTNNTKRDVGCVQKFKYPSKNNHRPISKTQFNEYLTLISADKLRETPSCFAKNDLLHSFINFEIDD